MSKLLLPGDPGFSYYLNLPPPDPRQKVNYVVRSGGGLMEAVDDGGLAEYFSSGEYDERLSQIEEENPSEEILIEGITSDVLYLPCSVCIS
ncbi:MAG: hypothetical protein F6J97_13100 [Leptolyngbya sp. SIO4C1]|nr:hypothetical protein [Leptolyngbya sp. SIO4C1]